MAGHGARRPFLLMLVAAFTLAACGSSGGSSTNPPASGSVPAATATSAGSDSGSSANLDGCAIVTAADAQAVFNVPVTRSDEGTSTPQILAACVWDGGPGTGTMALVSKLLQFHLYDGSMFYAPDQYKELPGFEKIDGLGDGAFAYGTGSFDLVILIGERTVGLSASGFTPEDRARVRQAVLDLAAKVLGRI